MRAANIVSTAIGGLASAAARIVGGGAGGGAAGLVEQAYYQINLRTSDKVAVLLSGLRQALDFVEQSSAQARMIAPGSQEGGDTVGVNSFGGDGRCSFGSRGGILKKWGPQFWKNLGEWVGGVWG